MLLVIPLLPLPTFYHNMAIAAVAGAEFPSLTFSGINCNSLNMSASSKHNQLRKIYGITKLKTDIIFLSDIRICNKNLVSGVADIKKSFLTNPYQSYKFFHNSSSNKRGVGILIKNDLCFAEERIVGDPGENYILLRAKIKGTVMTLGAIYGPNNFDPDFFANLSRDIRNIGGTNIIIWGDWNCTFSNDNINENLDCLNMTNPPNLRHSNLLLDMCTDLDLTDPYRTIHPNRRDYSFVPRSNTQINRSRLDFFLISRNLFNHTSSCDINSTLQSTLFDHKAIRLSFSEPKTNTIRKPSISRSIIHDANLDIVVFYSTYETYLHHLNNLNLNQGTLALNLLSIGRIKQLLRLAGTPPHLLPPGEILPETIDNFRDRIQEARALKDSLDLDEIENLPLTVDPCLFMEALLNCVRNEVISYQEFIGKRKKEYIKASIERLSILKSDFDSNLDSIRDLEADLNDFYEAELTIELEKYSLFEHLNQEKVTPYFLKLAQVSQKSNKLTDVTKPDGTPFDSLNDQRDYITNFYASLYKLPEAELPYAEGAIENFLGPEILNHPVVTNSNLFLLNAQG